MKRRPWLLRCAAALVAPISVQAQQARRRRIGVLTDMARSDPSMEAMFTRLAELGWSEIRNLSVEYLVIEPDLANIAAQVRAFLSFGAEVIVTTSTPTALAVKAGAPGTPMVFNLGGDPVGLGLVASLARPGGNATGLTQYSYQTGIKLYGLLKELVPKAQRIAVMYEDGNASMQQGYDALRKHPASAGAHWRVFKLRDWRDVDTANLALAREPADGLLVFFDRITSSNSGNIVSLANARRMPAVYGSRYFFDVGGLLSFGIDTQKQFVRIADYVARILGGAKAAELAVEQPTQFELRVNLSVANSQGIAVPASVLVQAVEVVR